MDEQKPRRSPSQHSLSKNIQAVFNDVVDATGPPISHIGSRSSLNAAICRQNSARRTHKSDIRALTDKRVFVTDGTIFEEQQSLKNPVACSPADTRVDEPAANAMVAEPSANTRTEAPNADTTSESDPALMRQSADIDDDVPFKDQRGSMWSRQGGHEYHDGRGYRESRDQEAIGGLDDDDGFVKPEMRPETGEEDETRYPGPLALFVLVVGIAFSVFLISLDRTIITTAIPFISNEFKSYDDIGWYGSAYLLTASAFQPLYGRIYTLFDMKWAYLSSLAIFEAGSLLCALSPNSVVLIIGRSVQGLGSAGMLTGSFVVVSHAVPLPKRPMLTAVVGLMFGVGATAGPVLGGVFTDLVTWRWCFYVNLPIGGVTFITMIFFFHPPKKHALMGKSLFYRALELDLIGNVILLGAFVMLFLALQFTEERIPWNSAKVIGLLAGAGGTFTIFCLWQWWKAEGALIPPRILKQRTVAASCAAAFFLYAAILIHNFYLPTWFQAIENASAIQSGVNMIPYVLANAIFSVLAGIFVSANGYFIIPAVIGTTIGTIGSYFLSTIGPDTSTGRWIGYQVLVSAGLGMAIQQGFTAVQIVLPLEEAAIGTAAVVASQSLGGAIFIAVGNTILSNRLLDANIPGVNIDVVLTSGAADFRKFVPAEKLAPVVAAYASAMQKVFTAAIPMAGMAVVACCFLEFRSVKEQQKEDGGSLDKAREDRRQTEMMILQAHRDTNISEVTQRT